MESVHNPAEQETSYNLGISLVESVSKAGAGDIAADAAEIALDSILDEGLLEEVPVFGWLKKSYNIVGTVRDRIFLKKVANFLAGTRNMSEEHRSQFSERIKCESDYAKKVGESLVLLLERQEDFEKALILGKVFSRYVCGHIKYEKFLKLAKSIELVFIGDLRNLAEYYASIQSYDPKQGKPFNEWLDDQTSQSLYSCGLIRSEGYTENVYRPNDMGEELLRCMEE